MQNTARFNSALLHYSQYQYTSVKYRNITASVVLLSEPAVKNKNKHRLASGNSVMLRRMAVIQTHRNCSMDNASNHTQTRQHIAILCQRFLSTGRAIHSFPKNAAMFHYLVLLTFSRWHYYFYFYYDLRLFSQLIFRPKMPKMNFFKVVLNSLDALPVTKPTEATSTERLGLLAKSNTIK